MAVSPVPLETGAMIRTQRHHIELEIPGARRITGDTCSSASAQAMAEGSGSVKGMRLCRPPLPELVPSQMSGQLFTSPSLNLSQFHMATVSQTVVWFTLWGCSG